jgi:hypothetical protein
MSELAARRIIHDFTLRKAQSDKLLDGETTLTLDGITAPLRSAFPPRRRAEINEVCRRGDYSFRSMRRPLSRQSGSM